jgi:hypothetical protein
MIKRAKLFRGATLISVAAFLLTTLAATHTLRADPPDPNIGVSGFFSSDKAQRGRAVQAAVVLDIPGGYHVNSNRPMSKYAIATVVKVDGPGGLKIGPVVYPRATVRRLKASNNQPLALFEGRAVIRFTIMVPPNFQQGMTELKANIRYQSCNDEVCFPPQTRQISMPIGVVGGTDAVKRINGNIFGRR